MGSNPGPLLMREHPDVFWGLVSSLYLGNVFLLLLNLPLIGIWVQVLKVPYRILFPLILLFCLIGTFSVNNSSFDLYLMIFFGVGDYLLRKFGYESAPLILAYVLGPLLEQSLRQSLRISGGDFSIFVARPISGTVLALSALLLLSSLFPYIRRRRRQYDDLKE